MKKSVSKKSTNMSKGFTLVEILVTIAILAVLMSISIPIVLRSANKGQIVKAKDVMASLNTAFDLYRNDNSGMYPISSSGSTPSVDEIRDTSDPTNLFIPALIGAANTTNFDRVEYFKADEATNGRSGIDPTGALFDPWGNGYIVCVDFDSDRMIDMANTGLPTDSFFNTTGIKRESIIPLCLGSNGVWEIGKSFWLFPGEHN